MDFNIDEGGDLILNDMKTRTYDQYRYNIAKSRIKSIKEDWYGDNIGANLEEMFGSFMTPTISNELKDKIYDELTRDYLYTSNDIYIETTTNKEDMAVSLKIYIKSSSSNSTYKTLDVYLDLFNGILL